MSSIEPSTVKSYSCASGRFFHSGSHINWTLILIATISHMTINMLGRWGFAWIPKYVAKASKKVSHLCKKVFTINI